MPDRAKLSPSRQTPSAVQAEPVLAMVIGYVRRRLTVGLLARRLLSMMAMLEMFPLLVVIGDHITVGGLPRPLIFGTGILWLAAAIIGSTGVSFRTISHRLNDAFLARHVERAHGVEHNPLLNTVLLERGGDAPYAHGVAVRQAAAALERTEWHEGGGMALRRPAAYLLAAAALWLLYASISPKPIIPSLARMAGFDRAAPTATRVELVRPAPDQPVYAGEPLEIEFSLAGRPVDSAAFELRDPSDTSNEALLRREAAIERGPEKLERALVLLSANEVARDLYYRFTAGDAVLEGVIAVISRAELVTLDIELTPPAYIGAPMTRSDGGDLYVWAGTRAAIVATSNTDIAAPVFVHRGEAETRTRMMVSGSNPRQATLSTGFLKSGDYWIEFSDVHGRACRDPRVGRVTVRHDAPPRIEIVTPSREDAPADVVDVAHTAILRVAASDDVRLEAVVAATDRDGSITRRELLSDGAAVVDSHVEIEIPTASFELAVGESVVVWFEAVDNCHRPDGVPSPQTALSRSLTLVRTAEPTPRDTGEDLTDKNGADAADAETETTKKAVVGDGEGGGDELAGEGGGDTAKDSGGNDGEGIYRPAREGDATDDAATSDPLDPQSVVSEGDGETEDSAAEAGGENTDDPNAAADSDQKFTEELRKFEREHGDEAREVRKVLGQRADDPETDGGGASDGGEPGEQRGPLDDDAEAESDSVLDDQPEPAPADQNDPNGAAEEREPIDVKAETPPATTQPQPTPPEKEQESQEASTDDAQQESPATQPDVQPKPKDPRDASPSPPETKAKSDDAESAEAQGPSETANQPQNDNKETAEATSDEEKADSANRDAKKSDPAKPAKDADDQVAGKQPESRDAQQPAADSLPESGGQTIPMPGDRPLDVSPATEPEPAEGDNGDVSRDSGSPADLTDTLELLARGEDVTDDALAELDWPPARRQAFIESFERLRETARRAGALSRVREWQARAELGSVDVESGAALSGEVSADISSVSPPRSGLDQIAPDREQRVAPELQAILDAYYRSLAERRAAERGP